MLQLIKNRCQKLAYALVAENRSQKLTYLASSDWQPVPKCVPFFLFLLPCRSLYFSQQLHFSLFSPCNLAKMRALFSFSSSPPQSPFLSTTSFLSSLSLQPTPKCVPFLLFLLPHRSLHFSQQLHFSLLSPCNLPLHHRCHHVAPATIELPPLVRCTSISCFLD